MDKETLSLLIMGASKIAGEIIRYRPLKTGFYPESSIKVTAEAPPETAPTSTVSNTETLAYQLDLILDDISHLETEHLPAQGKIANKPCDCIAKAGRSLHRHALETVSIAARQGKDPAVFSELATIGSRCMQIGTLDAVASRQFDSEYLKLAGEISNLRKQIDLMLADVQKSKKPAPIQEITTLAKKVSEGEITREQAVERIKEMAKAGYE